MSGRLKFALGLMLALPFTQVLAAYDKSMVTEVQAAPASSQYDVPGDGAYATDDGLSDAVMDEAGNVVSTSPIEPPEVTAADETVDLSVPSADRERIDHFDVTLKLEPSGDLLITERIQVTATGDKINHGIYRDIPTTYSLPGKLVRKTPVDLLSVTRDGHSEPYKKERTQWGVRYYLGSPDAYVEHGQHVYELRYRMDAQLHFTANKDELYWNLTGNQWLFPITHATATIELPEGARIDQMTGYTGYAGSRTGRAYTVVSRGDNVVKLATTQPLAAEEGFTIALDWQAGLVKRPSSLTYVLRVLWDNLSVLLGILAVIGLFAYYFHWWRKVGRDPAKGVIIPRYEAPSQVSPARAGYVWNEGFGSQYSDVEAFTITVTDLARRKMLSIADAPKGSAFLITKGEVTGELQPHENKLLKRLFEGKSPVRVGDKYVKALENALDDHSEKLREWGDKLFTKNRKPWFLGILGAVLAFVAMGVLSDPQILFALFPLIFIAVGVGLMGFGWSTLKGPPLSFLGVVPIFFGLPFALAGAGTAIAMIYSTSPYISVSVVLMVVLILLFRRWLEAPTIEGRQTLDALEGYREYLQLAETDTLARAADAPAMTIALYEQHLPYAMALGVEKQWTARLSAAIAAGVIDMSLADYRPEWTRNSTRFSTATAFSGAFISAAATASSPPPSPSSGSSGSSSSSSSSSSGEGSSGGGGGGGGGGGW